MIVTSGASNDIEQATKLASMVTRLGMSETFDMTALETVNNQYLGGDPVSRLQRGDSRQGG